MITKKYQDRFQRAGDEAEKQIIPCVRHTFGDDPDVQVFHNLRPEDGGEVAQKDLLLRCSGAVIFESKTSLRTSGSTTMTGGRGSGPAENRDAVPGVTGPATGGTAVRGAEGPPGRGAQQGDLQAGPARTWPARLGCGGGDQRPGRHPAPGRVDGRSHVRSGAGAGTRTDARSGGPGEPDEQGPARQGVGMTLKPEKMIRTVASLHATHRERMPTSSSPPVDPCLAVPALARTHLAVGPVDAPALPGPLAAAASFSCQKCSGTRLQDTSGKYGHQFTCLRCGSTIRIDLKCQTCQGNLRIRKRKQEFFAKCGPCGTSDISPISPDRANLHAHRNARA